MKSFSFTGISVAVSVMVLLVFGFNNCAQNGNVVLKSELASLGSIPTQADPTEILKTIQPAVAVRGMACIMCHSRIQSNVITDFGYGNSWFLGANRSGFETNASWYGNYAHAWQSITEFKGTVYVPNQLIPTTLQAELKIPASPRVTIAEMMGTPYTESWNYYMDASVKNAAMNAKLKPEKDKPGIVAVSQIVISAPTEKEILDLIPQSEIPVPTTGIYRIGSKAPVQLKVIAAGTTKEYVMNDETLPLECENSDIVIKGTLYLKNFQVKAAKGCRIYVTGSVFLENAVTYVGGTSGDATLQNLQISSANAISMGVDELHLRARYNWDIAPELAGARTYNQRFTQLLTEVKNIGTVVDARPNNEKTAPSVRFNSVLLNAPIIESRYFGQIKGTIVAEIALFALEEFIFVYDDVFSKVNVLPLLQRPILLMK